MLGSIGETATQILTLGGNESDAVRSQFEPRAKLLGYWWPESVPLPDGGVIEVTSEAGIPRGRCLIYHFPYEVFWRGRLALPTRWSVLRRDTLTPKLGGFCEGLLGGKSARSGVRVQMSHSRRKRPLVRPKSGHRGRRFNEGSGPKLRPAGADPARFYIARFAIIRAKPRRRNGCKDG